MNEKNCSFGDKIMAEEDRGVQRLEFTETGFCLQGEERLQIEDVTAHTRRGLIYLRSP